MSKTWKLIRGALSQGVSDRSIKSLIIENVEEASEMKIAEEFNNFFSSVAVDLSAGIAEVSLSPLHYIESDMSNSFFMYPVSEAECSEIIAKTKMSYTGTRRYYQIIDSCKTSVSTSNFCIN